jgi:hypothetical protein
LPCASVSSDAFRCIEPREVVTRLLGLIEPTVGRDELDAERSRMGEIGRGFLPPGGAPLALAPVPGGRVFVYEQIKVTIDDWIGSLLSAIPHASRAAFLDELSTPNEAETNV